MRTRCRPPSAQARPLAAAAWAYPNANTRPTGLVDTVAGFPSTTMWDTGSALLGMVAARELGVIPAGEFGDRAGKLVGALAALPLIDGKVFNKSYHTETRQMVDYDNQPAPQGIGWQSSG